MSELGLMVEQQASHSGDITTLTQNMDTKLKETRYTDKHSHRQGSLCNTLVLARKALLFIQCYRGEPCLPSGISMRTQSGLGCTYKLII